MSSAERALRVLSAVCAGDIGTLRGPLIASTNSLV
jgi:hypothetical protein